MALTCDTVFPLSLCRDAPRDNRQKATAEDDRYPLAPVVLEVCVKASPNLPSGESCLNPGSRLLFRGWAWESLPRACAWQIAP